MRWWRFLLHNEAGSALVEMTIVVPLLLILTFGLVEFGHVLWEYNAAEKATAVGARYLATLAAPPGNPRQVLLPLVTPLVTLPDCFVSSPLLSDGVTPATAGIPCAQVKDAPTWSMPPCRIGSGGCNDAVMQRLLRQMQRIAPFVEGGNVQVLVRGSGMGFIGRGAAVPLITVRTTGLTYNFVALDKLLGLPPITMPGFDATSVGEDQREGPPS